MRFGRKFAAAMAAAVLMSALPVTTYGEVIVYSPGKTTTTNKDEGPAKEVTLEELINTGKLTIDQIAQMGPGYASQIVEKLGEGLEEVIEEDNKIFDGPGVKEISLREYYHDLYKTYEESMADLFFLYTNVKNGGMTHEPVIIDIPAHVSYSVEKDGLPYEYISKAYISEKGTYVMKLSGIENRELPLSEQVEYKATFRFRITDEPPVEETKAAESASVSGSVTIGNGNVSVELNKEVPIIVPPTTEAVEETETEPESIEETEVFAQPEISTAVKRNQNYEKSTGNYLIIMENGMKLTASAPEGYIGPEPVYLSVSEDDAVITNLYKNDELVEFTNNTAISGYGKYRVEMDGYSYYFTIANKVNDMDHYPAPTDMKFVEVRFNDEAIALTSNQYVQMQEDGTYSFKMIGKDGEVVESVLTKDTVIPDMAISIVDGAAQIQYLSDDITEIELIKDGEVVPGFAGTSITDPGKYTLTIYDDAGNGATASFDLSYQMNIYGILAIVLVLLSIGGIVGFVIYIKKHTKVR